MAKILRNMVLCVVTAVLALGAGYISTAQGTDIGNVRVEIESMRHGGVLYVSITNVDLGHIKYLHADPQVTDGTLTIVVADMPGNAWGWSVTLTGTDIVDVDHPSSAFGLSQLSLSPGTVVASPATGHATNTGPTAAALVPQSSTPQLALRAQPGTGAGIYVNSRQADLTIPAGTRVGDYQATILLSITGTAPGE